MWDCLEIVSVVLYDEDEEKNLGTDLCWGTRKRKESKVKPKL